MLVTLKKFRDGLITHQIFDNDNPVQEPLSITGDYEYTNTNLILRNGIVLFYPKDNDNLVFEVDNSFHSSAPNDVGGISIIASNGGYHLYEYANPDNHVDFRHIRVTKKIKSYYGEGSADRDMWIQTGMRFIPGVNAIGVTYYAQNQYPINSIKIYREPTWQIFGLVPGFRIRMTDPITNLYEEFIAEDRGMMRFSNPYYPFTCQVEIWNNDNIQVLNKTLENIWGGDQYAISVNVHLYDERRELLHLEDARYLGTARTHETLSVLIYAVNHNSVTANIRIFVGIDSPAYEWVHLGYDNNAANNRKELFLSIPPNDEIVFWIHITNPRHFSVIPPDYFEGKEYLFFLELEDTEGGIN